MTKKEKIAQDKYSEIMDSKSVNKIKKYYFHTFEYDSKLYEDGQLSFYDIQPLILVIGETKSHVLGINFHYLPPKIRERALNKIKNVYGDIWTGNRGLNFISWDTIKMEVKGANHMVKLYIKDRIKDIKRIKNTDMESIVELRSENFIGAPATGVWRSLGLPI